MEVGNRIGDIIIEIVLLVCFKNVNSMYISKGGYGYMNMLFDMGVMFVVVGFVFKMNIILFVFSNLEVYFVLVKIFGIVLVMLIDGKLDVLEKVFIF